MFIGQYPLLSDICREISAIILCLTDNIDHLVLQLHHINIDYLKLLVFSEKSILTIIFHLIW